MEIGKQLPEEEGLDRNEEPKQTRRVDALMENACPLAVLMDCFILLLTISFPLSYISKLMTPLSIHRLPPLL